VEAYFLELAMDGLSEEATCRPGVIRNQLAKGRVRASGAEGRAVTMVLRWEQLHIFTPDVWNHRNKLFFKDFIYLFERKRKSKREEGEGQADSELSAEPNTGPNLTTPRSQPELKPRVRLSTN